MVISRIERESRSHGLLRLHLVGRAPVPRRRLRLAELYRRRRRLPVRRAAGPGLLLGLAALDEDADGHDEHYARFYASSRLHCKEEACKERLWRAPNCASVGNVNALYTGNQEDFSKSERKLSEGAVIGISVSVTLGGFLMLVYGSYFLYKRNTGYSVRWIRFQEEESDLAHMT